MSLCASGCNGGSVGTLGLLDGPASMAGRWEWLAVKEPPPDCPFHTPCAVPGPQTAPCAWSLRRTARSPTAAWQSAAGTRTQSEAAARCSAAFEFFLQDCCSCRCCSLALSLTTACLTPAGPPAWAAGSGPRLRRWTGSWCASKWSSACTATAPTASVSPVLQQAAAACPLRIPAARQWGRAAPRRASSRRHPWQIRLWPLEHMTPSEHLAFPHIAFPHGAPLLPAEQPGWHKMYLSRVTLFCTLFFSPPLGHPSFARSAPLHSPAGGALQRRLRKLNILFPSILLSNLDQYQHLIV